MAELKRRQSAEVVAKRVEEWTGAPLPQQQQCNPLIRQSVEASDHAGVLGNSVLGQVGAAAITGQLSATPQLQGPPHSLGPVPSEHNRKGDIVFIRNHAVCDKAAAAANTRKVYMVAVY